MRAGPNVFKRIHELNAVVEERSSVALRIIYSSGKKQIQP